MWFRLAAEVVLSLHLALILFAVLGALLFRWWRWTPLIHLPLATWAIYIEVTGRTCPLTFLENYLRVRAGQAGYPESFIEHYLLAVVYPAGLTRESQFVLASMVILINLALYAGVIIRRRHLRREG